MLSPTYTFHDIAIQVGDSIFTWPYSSIYSDFEYDTVGIWWDNHVRYDGTHYPPAGFKMRQL